MMQSVHRSRLPFAAGASLLLSLVPAEAGCNSGNISRNSALHGAGCLASATGVDALAVGFEAVGQGNQSVAVGTSAEARGIRAIALGFNAGNSFLVEGATTLGAWAGNTGAGLYSTAIGSSDFFDRGPLAAGAFSVAIGSGSVLSFRAARAIGERSIAIGQLAASADFGTSLGYNTQTTALGATAVGSDAAAIGVGASAVGRFSRAAGSGAAALGTGSLASGLNAAAVGPASRATGAYAIALGHDAQASILQAMALGPSARATELRAVAIGYNSLANAPSTVSVGRPGGERRITNVRAAVAGTDAVNLAQVQSLIAAARMAAPAPAPAHAAGPGSARASNPPSVADVEGDLAPSTIVGWASIGRDGTIAAARNIVAATRHGPGRHEVVFRKAALGSCALTANPSGACIVAVRVGAAGQQCRDRDPRPQRRADRFQDFI